MRRLRLERAAAVGAVVAPVAVTAFAVAVEAIQPRHFFGSPTLYVLLALSWFVGLPLFVLLQRWLQLRLERYLLCGLVLALLAYVLLWFKWDGPPPLNPRSVVWIVGHPFVGAVAFWAVLRLIGPEEFSA